ncbi:MAG TPA: guanylate kinase [Bacteroidia bacterium]|nr:guanylate kinase [Bacteroidia bacterium]HNS11976.1 guanylate kinase [Bacteroidia bacterium]
MDVTGKLLLFCGPSGSGKTTLVHYLLKKYPRLKFSVSATTRPMRSSEKDGVDYHFLSVEEFKKKIAADEFVEWEQVYEDRYYGTLKSEIERIWTDNGIVVFDVDVEGGLKIKKIFGDRLLAVFVMPPSVDELHNRLKARNSETSASYKARIMKSEHELTYAFRFDYVLINDNLEVALEEAERVTQKFINK